MIESAISPWSEMRERFQASSANLEYHVHSVRVEGEAHVEEAEGTVRFVGVHLNFLRYLDRIVGFGTLWYTRYRRPQTPLGHPEPLSHHDHIISFYGILKDGQWKLEGRKSEQGQLVTDTRFSGATLEVNDDWKGMLVIEGDRILINSEV
jgi:hypothetical protein